MNSHSKSNVPKWKAEIRQRLADLRLAPTREAEIVEELAQHIDDRYEELLASGVTAGEASRTALAELSDNGLLTRELQREEREVREDPVVFGTNRSRNMLADLWQDLGYGKRMLMKARAFTVVAVLALALGIAANTAIFSVVNAVLLRPLPYGEADRLVMVWETTKDTTENTVSYPNVSDWTEQNKVFEAIASYRPYGFTLTGAAEPEKVNAAIVSQGFVPLLQITPMLGRSFLPEEDRPGAERVVMLSYGFWQRRFGGSANIISQKLVLTGQAFTVIGVLPASFKFPDNSLDPDLLASIALERILQRRGARVARIIARLKPGVSVDRAQAGMNIIARRLEQQYPQFNAGAGISVLALHDQLVGRSRRALWVLLGAVGCLLFIACADVANLLLVRVSARQKELAIRAALGANQRRIVQQLLTESLLVAFLGGGFGLLAAYLIVKLMARVGPSTLPRFNEVTIDLRVLGFTALATLVTGIIFGVAPALKASKRQLNDKLKDGGRRGVGGKHQGRARGVLVVTQMSLALVLLVSAGLLMKSFLRIQSVSPGFNPEKVLTMRLTLPATKYQYDYQRIAFFSKLLSNIETLPGVASAALGTPIPFSHYKLDTSLTIEGRPAPPPGQELSAGVRAVTPGYFRTLSIPVVDGRIFTEQDKKGQLGTVVINKTMADRYWPNENPIGHRISGLTITFDNNEPTQWRIVGIVGDVKDGGLNLESAPEIYLPHNQLSSSWGYLAVRTITEPLGLAAAVREQVTALDRDQPVSDIASLESLVGESVVQPRFYSLLLLAFAGAGLALAILGIYGVMSSLVTDRTHELGIRIALGASSVDVFQLVLGKAMHLSLFGVFLGLTISFALTRLMKTLLFGVSTTDPATFAAVALLLILVAMLACYIPARRATKVDPLVALRYE